MDPGLSTRYLGPRHPLYSRGTLVLVNVSFPTTDGTNTDANWGPQNASHPTTNDATATIAEAQSLLGYVVFHMGGTVCWGLTHEKGTVSRSSCKSKMYAKSALTIQNLLYNFSLQDGIDTSPPVECQSWVVGLVERHVSIKEGWRY
jgi:hypothetical protein